ncbi:hypothetical protein D3C74_507760 [compost metagenome]
MPVPVIDLLKVVDVQYGELHRERIALLMLNQPAQILVESLMVIQIRQRVNLGETVHNDVLYA